MGNTFCHIDLTTHDPGAAREFYGSLFDWKMDEMDMGEHGTYTTIDTGAEPGGGLMASPSPEVPTCWMMYIEVDDLDACLSRATELGGNVMMGKSPVGEMGWFAVLTDPTGGAFGIWEAAPK